MRDRFFIVALGLAALAGCGDRALNGNPGDEPEVPDPRTITSFPTLFEQSCAGCHGVGGAGGLAVDLGDPGYLATASDATIRDAIATGRRGTAMPPFAQREGGTLSDQQIDVLVRGIRGWASPSSTVASTVAPPAGDAARGAATFRARCGFCHGADGRGGPGGSAITDGAFLALTSDASLRTTIVAGRPDLGCPDHLGTGGAAMSAEEVSDTVAWLAAQRVAFPGQPYPTATANGSK